MMNIKGKKAVDSIHKELGHIMWEYVCMGRTAEGLKEGLKKLKEVRKEFEKELDVYKRQLQPPPTHLTDNALPRSYGKLPRNKPTGQTELSHTI